MKNILSEYDEQEKKYSLFSQLLQGLVGKLLFAREIKTHSISSRLKDRTSLENKIKDKVKYNSLNDITDVVGVRIITHYSDEIDSIAEVIEQEFDIDRENSIDKRIVLEPDRFGYLSLHYIVSLKQDRYTLSEYSSFKGLKAEIQIRSILQHAWAEISHDTGYKSEITVPHAVKRQFSRLAGLLELADDEFVNIKNKLNEYIEEVNWDLKNNEIKHTKIDGITLPAYIEESKHIAEIVGWVEANTKIRFSSKVNGLYIGTAIASLNFLGVDTLLKLEKILIAHSELIKRRCISINSNHTEAGLMEHARESIVIYAAQVTALAQNKTKDYCEALFHNSNDPAMIKFIAELESIRLD